MLVETSMPGKHKSPKLPAVKGTPLKQQGTVQTLLNHCQLETNLPLHSVVLSEGRTTLGLMIST
jgi:hypothetical protein